MTTLALPVRAPFDLAQTRDRITTFAPCRSGFVLEADAIVGAHAVGDGAIAWRLGPTTDHAQLRLDLAGQPSAAVTAEVGRLVAAMIGADDDLAEFYRRAAGDHPAFRAIVARHHGLHHVRFPSLAEVTCHAILSQRTPMAVASALKRRVVEAYGGTALFGDHTLRAFPTLATIRRVPEAELAALLRNPEKARRLHDAVVAIDDLGEAWLRTAPYEQVASALHAIRGFGPFSVTMVLLRGLGRTDHMDPRGEPFATIAGSVYGAAWDAGETIARYGSTIGTWAYYLRVGADSEARQVAPPRAAAPRRARPAPVHGVRSQARLTGLGPQ